MNMKYVGCLALLLASHSSWAEVDWVSLIWHNDLFAGKDGGGYTNGAYVSWYDVSNEGEKASGPPLLTRPLVWMLTDDPEFTVAEYTLGQTMITPKDISKPHPDPNDAPYAGLLFLRTAFTSVHENYADTISTTIGIVGPASGAEKTQKMIHKMTGSTRPQGWDYQLKNEPVARLTRARVWRIADPNQPYVDAVFLGNLNVGNMESSVGTGVLFRVGTGLEKSFASAAQITGRINNPVAVDGGRYTYLGITLSYVHNQIFVNGNTFRSSPAGDLRHEQYSLIAGFAYSWSNFNLGLGYQNGSSLDRHSTSRESFGAVTLGMRL